MKRQRPGETQAVDLPSPIKMMTQNSPKQESLTTRFARPLPSSSKPIFKTQITFPKPNPNPLPRIRFKTPKCSLSKGSDAG